MKMKFPEESQDLRHSTVRLSLASLSGACTNFVFHWCIPHSSLSGPPFSTWSFLPFINVIAIAIVWALKARYQSYMKSDILENRDRKACRPSLASLDRQLMTLCRDRGGICEQLPPTESSRIHLSSRIVSNHERMTCRVTSPCIRTLTWLTATLGQVWWFRSRDTAHVINLHELVS